MFVDDLLSAIQQHLKKTRQFIAFSIELVYILIHSPGAITEPDLSPTISGDTMEDRPVCPEWLSIGVEFLNRYLEIIVHDYKVERLLELLNTEWSKGQKVIQRSW